MILHLAHYHRATRSPMQLIPDFQQDALAVRVPLMVPKSQFFDSFRGQKLFSHLVPLMLFRQPMLESIEFNGQLCNWAIEIEDIDSNRMLTAKFESGKTPCSQ